ncbi:MAG: ATP-binding cassette domain-containing protein [Chitinophagaceae bacterium]
MLEADGIQYSIKGRSILSNVYIKAEKGLVTGVIGSNGCGKSTLMNIVFGSLEAEYASVRIEGEKLKPGLHAKRIQYLPQFTILPENLTVGTIFRLYGHRLEDFVSCFPNVKVKSNARFGHLSKGTQRLVETYTFLKNDCDITLLDEPFSFNAPVYIEKIKQLIEEQKAAKTIVVTDHLYDHIQSVCDTIYLIYNGRTIAVDGPESLVRYGYLPESFPSA